MDISNIILIASELGVQIVYELSSSYSYPFRNAWGQVEPGPTWRWKEMAKFGAGRLAFKIFDGFRRWQRLRFSRCFHLIIWWTCCSFVICVQFVFDCTAAKNSDSDVKTRTSKHCNFIYFCFRPKSWKLENDSESIVPESCHFSSQTGSLWKWNTSHPPVVCHLSGWDLARPAWHFRHFSSHGPPWPPELFRQEPGNWQRLFTLLVVAWKNGGGHV